VVHQAVVAADQEDAWTRVQQPGFDPAVTVVLEDGQPLDIQPSRQADVQVVHYDANGLELEVNSPAEGYLFLSDPFYPGWRAKVDGEPVPILRANYAFRAVPVPASVHQVTMTFRPSSWSIGLAITALTIVILLVLAVVALVGRRRPDGERAEGETAVYRVP
jgi:hypothetical protein